MDQYKEFCRLRDYRKPGAEVCQHTEAEAFALATRQRLEQTVSESASPLATVAIAKKRNCQSKN